MISFSFFIVKPYLSIRKNLPICFSYEINSIFLKKMNSKGFNQIQFKIEINYKNDFSKNKMILSPKLAHELIYRIYYKYYLKL